MQKVIVIGDDHHNSLSLVRGLGMAGYAVELFVVADSGKSFVAHSKYVRKCHIVKSEKDVLAIMREEVKEVKERVPVTAASDKAAEMLDLNFDELSRNYIVPNCGGKQGLLSEWMNKEKMMAEADRCGMLKPYTVHVSALDETQIDTDAIPYPCVVKPSKSVDGSKDDFRICKDKSELKAVLEDMRRRGIGVLVQEYIHVDYEYKVCGVRSRKTGKNHLVGGLHKLKTCKDTNNMGMLCFAYTTSDYPSDYIKSSIDKFVESMGFEGLYSFEFMVSGDKVYFTEMNLRNDGCAFCWTDAGCNMTANWVKEMTEGVEPKYGTLKKTYCMVEISYAKYYHNNIFTLIKDTFKTKSFAIFKRNDIKPFIYKFINAI